jgi:hypothetical protein
MAFHVEACRAADVWDDTFLRTDPMSLKSGQHGAGPYTTVKQIFESLGSGRGGHAPVHARTDRLKLFLFPWKALVHAKEFRVFVHQGRVTAISQQHLHSANPLLAALPTLAERASMVKAWAARIVQAADKTIVPKLAGLMDSFTMDVVLEEEDNRVYFIEPNGFGAQYAAGSALFHWLKDEGKLLRTEAPSTVFVRYTI